MKRKSLIRNIAANSFYVAMAALLLCACDDAYEIGRPEFEVEVQEGEYFAGDAVRFKIAGNADLVSFFSGEAGHDIDYYGRDRYVSAGDLTATFKSIWYDSTPNMPTLGFGNSTMSPFDENGKLRVRMLVSTDFTGEKGDGFYLGLTGREGYANDAIRAATWTDVTDRFTWATEIRGGDRDNDTFSLYGTLNDLIVEGRPMYIAFAVDMPGFEGTRETKRLRFSIWEFRLKCYPPESNPIDVFTHDTKHDFLMAHFGPYPEGATGWVNDYGGARGQIYFNSPADVPITEPFEMWAISQPIDVPTEKINVGPDWSLPIKALHEPPLTDYSHIYEKAGTYKAAFVATNASPEGRYSVIREISVVVKERP